MKKYVILSDTGCDLEAPLREKYNIECVPMHYVIDGKDYVADIDFKPFSAKQFYDFMREGKKTSTAQVNVATYKEAFNKYLSEGYDILYIACSSGLSASISSAKTAREEVLKLNPEAKIVIVDTLRACYALGLLVITASELRSQGKTIEEVAEWVENNKNYVHMTGSVDKLTWLKQAGRVSATSAFFGGLLNIKPIIVADALGQNFAVTKLKGRKASLEYIAEDIKNNIVECEHQKVFISHADCIEDAETLKTMVLEKLGKDIDIHIGYVGPCVGSAVGPGMIGVYYFGTEMTLNKGE